MTVAIVILLAVLTIELGVILWALARPLLGLGRIAEALAVMLEEIQGAVERITGPTTGEAIRDAGAKFADSMRSPRDE